MIMNDTQTLNRIVIQGVPGAFHEIAARHFYSEKGLMIKSANTFDELVGLVEKGKVDGGIMAIENSIAGSLLYNYQLLSQSSLKIIGEIYLRIKHNLMVLPGVAFEDLKEVYSHPMAIAQCREYFKNYPKIKLISAEDTALSAKRVQDKKWKQAGAIASKLSAHLYGLEMLAEGIETNKKNYTRFLILDRGSEAVNSDSPVDKVSICFTLKHEIGSLHRVLKELALHQTNLTKIESSPILGREWQYLFFIDFVFDAKVNPKKVIESIQPLTSQLKVLGQYPKGMHYEN